jgi:hypothetical protein
VYNKQLRLIVWGKYDLIRHLLCYCVYGQVREGCA